MENLARTPFILRFAEPAVPTVTPGSYDKEKQLWISPEGCATSAHAKTLATSAPERTDEIDQGEGV